MTEKRFTLRVAVYIILIKGEKVLLSRRFNTGWMDGKYSLISGHIDGNESISKAMIREAKEEIGIKIIKKDLIPITVLHRKSGIEYMDFFYLVKKWSGQPRIMEPEKCDDLNWFFLSKLPKSILPHIREVIQNYKKSVPFFEFGW